MPSARQFACRDSPATTRPAATRGGYADATDTTATHLTPSTTPRAARLTADRGQRRSARDPGPRERGPQIDPRNANRGTPRGRALLESSLREYGAGRAVLTDRDGVLIAGNKTFEVAQRLGIPTRVIETDGQELVVVSRRDLHLASDPKARALAIADNVTSRQFVAPAVYGSRLAGCRLTPAA